MRRHVWAAGAALLAFVFPLCTHAGPLAAQPTAPWPVAVTFDGGPHPRLTAKILDILARSNPQVRDVDPAQIIDNHWVQQLVDSGFVSQLYGR